MTTCQAMAGEPIRSPRAPPCHARSTSNPGSWGSAGPGTAAAPESSDPGGRPQMPTVQDVQGWQGRTLVDADGDKIGKIEDIYLDRQSGDPEWVAVKTGLFGTRVSFVPIRDATATGDEVRVAHQKDKVKDAPNIEADGELSPDEERVLYEHYGREDYGHWTDESEDRSERLMGRETRGDDSSTGEAGTADAGTAGLAGTAAAGTAAAERGEGTRDTDSGTGTTAAGGAEAGEAGTGT